MDKIYDIASFSPQDDKDYVTWRDQLGEEEAIRALRNEVGLLCKVNALPH
jgi:hypothetical protein